MARLQAARVALAASRPLSREITHTLDDRWSPSLKVGQANLVARWRADALAGVRHDLRDVGFRVFSQFEEDGLLLYILTVIGPRTRRFIDIGAADGINSNCANLVVNHGWHGLFIEGDGQKVARGRAFYGAHPDSWAFPPVFVEGFARRDTINEMIETAGFSGEVDLMSIDIDGNDYWVWDALEVANPRLVIIETHIEFGLANIVVPYDPDYVYPGRHPDYHGASIVAMQAMAATKGYRLVGANAYGFNTLWLRDDEAVELLPIATPESILAGHPRNAARASLFEPLREWPYVRGGSGFPGSPRA